MTRGRPIAYLRPLGRLTLSERSCLVVFELLIPSQSSRPAWQKSNGSNAWNIMDQGVEAVDFCDQVYGQDDSGRALGDFAAVFLRAELVADIAARGTLWRDGTTLKTV